LLFTFATRLTLISVREVIAAMTIKRLLNRSIAALLLSALAVLATGQKSSDKVTADSVLAELKAGNAHHVAHRYQHPNETAERLRVDGVAQVACDGGTLAVADDGADGEVLVVIAPHEIVLARERPAGSALNVFAGPVEELTPEPPQGERVRVRIASRPPLVAEVTRASAAAMGLAPGVPVHASFKATGARVFR